jgi:hypothetical protein
MALNPHFTSELPGNFKKLELWSCNLRDSDVGGRGKVTRIFLKFPGALIGSQD